MEQIEKLFEALEEQGLYRGHILYKGKKYVLPRGRGLKKLYMYGYMLAIVLIIIFIAISWPGEYNDHDKREAEYLQYESLARKQLKEENYKVARISALKAKEKKETPQIAALLKDIEDKEEAVYRSFLESAKNHLKNGNYKSALDAAERAKSLKDTPEVRQLIEDIKRKENEKEKENEDYREYEDYFNSAQEQWKAGNYQVASNLAKKAEALAKKMKNPKYIRGIQELKEKINEAIKRKKREDDYQLFFKKANNEYNAGNHQEALKWAEKAIDLAKKIKNSKYIQESQDLIKNTIAYNEFLDSAREKLKKNDFRGASEDAKEAQKIKNAGEIDPFVAKIKNKEDKVFNQLNNSITEAYRQGDFKTAREKMAEAEKMTFNEKFKEEFEKIKSRISPLTIDISENYPLIKTIIFELVEPNEFSIVRISEGIPYFKIGQIKNLNILLKNIRPVLAKMNITLSVSALPSVFFESNQYTKLWKARYHQRNWEICTNNSGDAILLQKSGNNFEIVNVMDVNEENLNKYSEQIFVRFVLKEGGNDDKD